MLRLPLALMLFGTAILVATSSLASQDKGRPNYFPLVAGSKWHYRAEVLGQGAEAFVVTAGKMEKIDGVDMCRLETTKQGQPFATEHIASADQGVFRCRVNDQAVNKPVCILKYPIKTGDSWKDEAEVMGQKIKVSVRVGKEEDLKLAAGKFKAIAVHIDGEIGGQAITTTYWFAADVGIVKQVAEAVGQKMTLELEKYEKGK